MIKHTHAQTFLYTIVHCFGKKIYKIFDIYFNLYVITLKCISAGGNWLKWKQKVTKVENIAPQCIQGRCMETNLMQIIGSLFESLVNVNKYMNET